MDFTEDKLRYFINFTEKLCDTYGRRRRKFAIGLHNLDVINSPLVYDAARDKEFVPLGSNRKMSFENDHRRARERAWSTAAYSEGGDTRKRVPVSGRREGQHNGHDTDHKL